MIFAREIGDPLTSLVKKVDAVNKDKGNKMASYVVFLSDEEGIEKKLKGLSEKEKLAKTYFTIDNPAGPDGYKIDKSADVTVVFYVGKKVKSNHAFKKGELTADEIDKLLKDELPKIVDSDK